MKSSVSDMSGSRRPRTPGRVKLWPLGEGSAHRVARAEPANPIYLLAAITVGIPILLLILLVRANPGIQAEALTGSVIYLVVSLFVIAAVFEIKRLVDQRDDEERH